MDDKELLDLCSQSAACFRIGCEGMANERLIAVIDGVAERMHGLAPEEIPPLQGVLHSLFQAQSSRDFSYAADLLEYVLPASLCASKEKCP